MSNRQVVVCLLVGAGIAVFFYWLGSRQGLKQSEIACNTLNKAIATLQKPNQPVTVKSHEVKLGIAGIATYTYKKSKTA